MSGRLRLLLAPAIVLVAALAVALSARATVGCTFNDTFDIVTVGLGANNDFVKVQVGAP